MQPSHLGFPPSDLGETRVVMTDIIGAGGGREATRWVDFDLLGNQVSAHLADTGESIPTNPVDGHAVSTFHFWGRPEPESVAGASGTAEPAREEISHRTIRPLCRPDGRTEHVR